MSLCEVLNPETDFIRFKMDSTILIDSDSDDDVILIDSNNDRQGGNNAFLQGISELNPNPEVRELFSNVVRIPSTENVNPVVIERPLPESFLEEHIDLPNSKASSLKTKNTSYVVSVHDSNKIFKTKVVDTSQKKSARIKKKSQLPTVQTSTALTTVETSTPTNVTSTCLLTSSNANNDSTTLPSITAVESLAPQLIIPTNEEVFTPLPSIISVESLAPTSSKHVARATSLAKLSPRKRPKSRMSAKVEKKSVIKSSLSSLEPTQVPPDSTKETDELSDALLKLKLLIPGGDIIPFQGNDIILKAVNFIRELRMSDCDLNIGEEALIQEHIQFTRKYDTLLNELYQLTKQPSKAPVPNKRLVLVNKFLEKNTKKKKGKENLPAQVKLAPPGSAKTDSSECNMELSRILSEVIESVNNIDSTHAKENADPNPSEIVRLEDFLPRSLLEEMGSCTEIEGELNLRKELEHLKTIVGQVDEENSKTGANEEEEEPNEPVKLIISSVSSLQGSDIDFNDCTSECVIYELDIQEPQPEPDKDNGLSGDEDIDKTNSPAGKLETGTSNVSEIETECPNGKTVDLKEKLRVSTEPRESGPSGFLKETQLNQTLDSKQTLERKQVQNEPAEVQENSTRDTPESESLSETLLNQDSPLSLTKDSDDTSRSEQLSISQTSTVHPSPDSTKETDPSNGLSTKRMRGRNFAVKSTSRRKLLARLSQSSNTPPAEPEQEPVSVPQRMDIEENSVNECTDLTKEPKTNGATQEESNTVPESDTEKAIEAPHVRTERSFPLPSVSQVEKSNPMEDLNLIKQGYGIPLALTTKKVENEGPIDLCIRKYPVEQSSSAELQNKKTESQQVLSTETGIAEKKPQEDAPTLRSSGNSPKHKNSDSNKVSINEKEENDKSQVPENGVENIRGQEIVHSQVNKNAIEKENEVKPCTTDKTVNIMANPDESSQNNAASSDSYQAKCEHCKNCSKSESKESAENFVNQPDSEEVARQAITNVKSNRLHTKQRIRRESESSVEEQRKNETETIKLSAKKIAEPRSNKDKTQRFEDDGGSNPEKKFKSGEDTLRKTDAHKSPKSKKDKLALNEKLGDEIESIKSKHGSIEFSEADSRDETSHVEESTTGNKLKNEHKKPPNSLKQTKHVNRETDKERLKKIEFQKKSLKTKAPKMAKELNHQNKRRLIESNSSSEEDSPLCHNKSDQPVTPKKGSKPQVKKQCKETEAKFDLSISNTKEEVTKSFKRKSVPQKKPELISECKSSPSSIQDKTKSEISEPKVQTKVPKKVHRQPDEPVESKTKIKTVKKGDDNSQASKCILDLEESEDGIIKKCSNSPAKKLETAASSKGDSHKGQKTEKDSLKKVIKETLKNVSPEMNADKEAEKKQRMNMKQLNRLNMLRNRLDKESYEKLLLLRRRYLAQRKQNDEDEIEKARKKLHEGLKTLKFKKIGTGTQKKKITQDKEEGNGEPEVLKTDGDECKASRIQQRNGRHSLENKEGTSGVQDEKQKETERIHQRNGRHSLENKEGTSRVQDEKQKETEQIQQRNTRHSLESREGISGVPDEKQKETERIQQRYRRHSLENNEGISGVQDEKQKETERIQQRYERHSLESREGTSGFPEEKQKETERIQQRYWRHSLENNEGTSGVQDEKQKETERIQQRFGRHSLESREGTSGVPEEKQKETERIQQRYGRHSLESREGSGVQDEKQKETEWIQQRYGRHSFESREGSGVQDEKQKETERIQQRYGRHSSENNEGTSGVQDEKQKETERIQERYGRHSLESREGTSGVPDEKQKETEWIQQRYGRHSLESREGSGVQDEKQKETEWIQQRYGRHISESRAGTSGVPDDKQKETEWIQQRYGRHSLESREGSGVPDEQQEEFEKVSNKKVEEEKRYHRHSAESRQWTYGRFAKGQETQERFGREGPKRSFQGQVNPWADGRDRFRTDPRVFQADPRVFQEERAESEFSRSEKGGHEIDQYPWNYRPNQGSQWNERVWNSQRQPAWSRDPRSHFASSSHSYPWVRPSSQYNPMK